MITKDNKIETNLYKSTGYHSLEEWKDDVIGGALYSMWKIYERTPSMSDAKYNKICDEIKATQYVEERK
jgi:hypothetical protein